MGANGLEIFHAETGDSVHTIPVTSSGIPAVAWHPTRYWLAYSSMADSGNAGGLRIVGAAGGGI